MTQENKPRGDVFAEMEKREEEYLKRKQAIEELAAERGLRTIFHNVWIEQGSESRSMPKRFFVGDYYSEKPELTELPGINFPISNIGELVNAIGSFDRLYELTENPNLYERHGSKGLISFAEEKFVKESTASQTLKSPQP